jgi:hypothetical protein
MSKKKLKKAYKAAMKNGYGAQACPVSGAQPAQGLWGGGGWANSLKSPQMQQFLIGALVGAAATYVLSNEELRSKIMKSALKLYSGMSSGFEEMKEQMADLQAELEAETKRNA